MANEIAVRITAENAQLLQIIQKSIKGFSDLDKGLDNTKKKAKATGLVLEKEVGGALTKLTGLLGAALTGLGLIGITKEAIDLNAQWETMQIALTTVTGSAQGAEKALSWIQNFTQSTPYELDQVSEAFIRLAAYGLDARKILPMVGDASASLNKPLMMGVEAVADAMQMEFERLKEFGIRATQQKDTVTFAWQEAGQTVKHTVAKDSNEILGVLSQAFAKYRGGMEAQSHSWVGIISNIMDVGKALAREGTNKVFTLLEGDLEALYDKLSKLQKDGTLDLWAEKTAEALTKVYGAIERFVTGGGIEYIIWGGKTILAIWAVEKFIAIYKVLASIATLLELRLVGSILLTAVRTKELGTAFTLLAGRFAPFLGPAGWIALLVAGFITLSQAAKQAQINMVGAITTQGKISPYMKVDQKAMESYQGSFNKADLWNKTDTQLSQMLKGFNAIIAKGKAGLEESKRHSYSPMSYAVTHGLKQTPQSHANTVKIALELKGQVLQELERRKDLQNLKKQTSQTRGSYPGFTYTEVEPSSTQSAKEEEKRRKEAEKRAKELAEKERKEREAYQEYLKAQSQGSEEQLKISLEAEKSQIEDAYNHFKISAEDYYKTKDELTKKSTEAEINNLMTQKEITQANAKRAQTPEEQRKAQTEILRLTSQISQAEARLNNTLAENAREKARALKEYQEAAQALKAELEALTGQGTKARKEEIDQKYQDQLEKAQIEGDQVTVDIILRIKDIQKAKLDLDSFYQHLDALKAKMENDQAKIDLLTNLAPLERDQEKLNLQKAFNEEVKKCIPDMEKLVAIINDPQAVNALENLKNGVARIDAQAGITKQTLAGAVGSGLEDFFANGIKDCHSLGDAFSMMASSIISDLQRILAHQLAMSITSSLFGINIGGSAEGGYIQGPGTSTSDSILHRLSNGEYVIRAKSVEKFGVAFFDALNAGYLPSRKGFASGGLVGGVSPTKASGSGGGVNIINVPDPNMVENYLVSSSGNRTILNVIESNKMAIRRLLT